MDNNNNFQDQPQGQVPPQDQQPDFNPDPAINQQPEFTPDPTFGQQPNLNQGPAPGQQPGYGGAPYGQQPGFNSGPAPGQQPGYPPQYNAPVRQVNFEEVPPEVRRWNWGAFMFNIWWGIGNNAYLCLLMLIPCLNIVWVFVCGAMGNSWAWKSGEFKDVEQFMAVQRTWNRAGLVWFVIAVIGVVLSIVMSIVFGLSLASILNDIDSGTIPLPRNF